MRNQEQQQAPGSQVTRRLAASAAQHPFTVTAAGAGALALIYLVLLSPIFGGGRTALVTLLAATAAALTNFIVRYRRDRSGVEQLVSDHSRQLAARSHAAASRRLAESLRTQFQAIEFDRGVAAVEAIGAEYTQVRTAIEQGHADGMLAAPHIAALVEETYRRGMSVLCDAVDLATAVRVPSKQEMRSRIALLRRQVLDAEEGESAEGRLVVRRQELELAERRLEEIDRAHAQVDGLLLHAHQCEAALARTRLGLASIRSGSTGARVDTVIEALQRTIQGAKEVQDELERLGYSADH